MALLAKSARVLATRVLGVASVFFVNLYLARVLGADGFGVYSLSLTIVTILAVVARFGIDGLALKEVSRNLSYAHDGHARGLMAGFVRTTIIASSIMVALILAFAGFLSDHVFDSERLRIALTMMSPLVFFMSIGYVVAEGLKGVQRASAGTFLQTSMLPAVYLAGVLVLGHYWGVTVSNASLLYSVVSLLVLFTTLVFWQRATSGPSQAPKAAVLANLKAGYPFLLISSGSLILSWSDVIVLGMHASDADVGVYSAAAKVAMLTGLILVAVNAIAAPMFSRLHAEGSIDELRAAAKKSTRVIVLLAIPPSIIMLVFPSYLMSFFGDGFSVGGGLLLVLALGQIVNVACGAVGFMLIMTGHERLMQRIILLAAVANLTLSLTLVQVYGAMGVAVATAVSIAGWNITALLVVRRKLGFWMTV